MEYVYWVIEGKLAGRPGPTRRPWDPEAFYEAGFRAIISLASDVPVQDLATYGFVHHRAQFPPVILNSEGMQKAFIHQALPVWAFIHEQLEAGNPTLVHCYAGKDRTGAILAGYLITYEAYTPEEAIHHLKKANPRALEAEGYEATVRRLEAGVLPDRRTLL